mgnify:CR=1 FL=1
MFNTDTQASTWSRCRQIPRSLRIFSPKTGFLEKHLITQRNSIVRVTERRITGVLNTPSVITKQNQIEEEKWNLEEVLRCVFALSQDGIALTDLDGKIVECNETLLEMHGYSSKEEVIGKSLLDLIVGRDHRRAVENLRKTMEQGLMRDVEYTFRSKDGREFPAELSASVLKDPSGNYVGFATITRDLTWRKQVEARLKERIFKIFSPQPIPHIRTNAKTE